MEKELAPEKQELDLNSILIAEYQYIAQTAFQANEDRARVSNFYFVTAAAAVAAIVGAKVEGTSTPGVYLGFSVLFAVLSLVGLLTLLQLARLRSAWTESAKAMNTIKQYYMDHFTGLHPEKAFAWTALSIPPVTKRKSVAFLLATSVMVVDAVTVATAVIYLGLALGSSPTNTIWLLAGILAGAMFYLVQFRLYLDWLK